MELQPRTDLKRATLIIILLTFYSAKAQTKDKLSDHLSFSGYSELYYSYDFANPANHEKPSFIYNFKRHNEINVNLLLVKATYNDSITRANLAVMAGNYCQYNLSAEPTWAQFINEANIGCRLSKSSNLWFDVGILPSHIGLASLISADNWTLTRSIAAENSPYFETGARISYSNTTDKLKLAFLVLNGWQTVQRQDNLQNPSFGLQCNYQWTPKLLLNYSNFIGQANPDIPDAWRFFNNFYTLYQVSDRVGLAAGFDIGADNYNPSDRGIWYTPVLVAKYSFNPLMEMGLRGEYFNDKNQTFIKTGTLNGFQTVGISANFDYKFTDKMEWRIEGKMYQSKDVIFVNDSDTNFSITTNLTFRL